MQEYAVAFCCDETFAGYTGIAATSLLANNPGIYLRIYILHSGFSQETRSRLERLPSLYPCEVHPIPISKEFAVDFPVAYPWHPATYYRLALPKYLPNEELVLYLDSDLIVDGSLEDLLTDRRIADHPCLMSQENDELVKERVECLSILSGGYYNAGVMYINLNIWREQMIAEHCIKYLSGNSDKIRFSDQCAINKILDGKIGSLGREFNFGLYRYRNLPALHKGKKIAIYHFTGPIKPWHAWSLKTAKLLFLKYASLSPWANSIKIKSPESIDEWFMLAERLLTDEQTKKSALCFRKIAYSLLKQLQETKQIKR